MPGEGWPDPLPNFWAFIIVMLCLVYLLVVMVAVVMVLLLMLLLMPGVSFVVTGCPSAAVTLSLI